MGEADDASAVIGGDTEGVGQLLVQTSPLGPGQQMRPVQHVRVAERAPRVAHPVRTEPDPHPEFAEPACGQDQRPRGRHGRQGNPRVRQLGAHAVEFDHFEAGHAERVTDADLALEGQRPGPVDDRVHRGQAGDGLVVEVDVDAHAVPVGDPEDQVELGVERLVEADRVDAAHDVDATGAGRLLQELRGAGRPQDAVLRERDDLHVDRVPQRLTRGADTLDTGKAESGRDIDMGPHGPGAPGDRVRHQPLGAVLEGRGLRAVQLRVRGGEFGDPRRGFARHPGLAPRGLVRVDVRVHQGRQRDPAAAVDDLGTLGRRTVDDHPVDDREVHGLRRTERAYVPEDGGRHTATPVRTTRTGFFSTDTSASGLPDSRIASPA